MRLVVTNNASRERIVVRDSGQAAREVNQAREDAGAGAVDERGIGNWTRMFERMEVGDRMGFAIFTNAVEVEDFAVVERVA